MRRGRLLIALMALALTPAPIASAQEALSISTPYSGVAVEPGDNASFELKVTAPIDGEVALAVTAVPDGWTATLRGGGFVVDTVTITDGVAPELRLDVTVPEEATEGTYDLGLSATQGGTTVNLPLAVRVSTQAGGSVTLTPDFPARQGSTDATFTFNLDLQNDTPGEISLELQAEGPEGWQLTATPSGQSQVSTVSAEGGGSARITVTARPAVGAAAGDYDLLVRAVGSGQDLQVPLVVRLTGSYEMILTTADDRLNTEVTAGRPSDLQLLVVNAGTALLERVEVSATAPTGWDVTFAPEGLAVVEPGQTAQVTATITPAGSAIAGDYVITFRSSVDQVQESMEVRATVSPSAVWGLVGIGLIALTLAGLAWVFRRFGRR